MFIGFDYGTANCSVAVMRDGKPQLLKMENDSTLLPSMLCAPTRESVSEWLYRHHDVPADDDETQALLRRAIRYNREEDIDVTAKSVQFGLSSLAQYIDDPEEVWFVKSPKSFLGASGLKPQQVALFEDLVCAMMLHIRQQAQAQLPEAITQAVIGRPINFQGLGGDEANAQAQGILERAAKRAGFRDVVFQYEPVAAGLDYEATLQEEKRVLVVDIGGGTTDCCSHARMYTAVKRIKLDQRSDDLYYVFKWDWCQNDTIRRQNGYGYVVISNNAKYHRRYYSCFPFHFNIFPFFGNKGFHDEINEFFHLCYPHLYLVLYQFF
ncbi:TPA: molecular chaperone [Escherichia coli]